MWVLQFSIRTGKKNTVLLCLPYMRLIRFPLQFHELQIYTVVNVQFYTPLPESVRCLAFKSKAAYRYLHIFHKTKTISFEQDHMVRIPLILNIRDCLCLIRTIVLDLSITVQKMQRHHRTYRNWRISVFTVQDKPGTHTATND